MNKDNANLTNMRIPRIINGYMKEILKNKKGTALFMSLMILAGVLTVSLGAASLIFSGIKQTRTQTHSTKAYYASEAGAERVLWGIRKNNADLSACIADDYINFDVIPVICDVNEHIYNIGDATYSVIYKSGAPTTTVSTGGYQDARRSVEISY